MAILASELFVGSAETVVGVHHSWIYPFTSFPMFQQVLIPRHCLINILHAKLCLRVCCLGSPTCNTASTLPKNTIFTHTKYLTSLIIYLTKCSYWGKKRNLKQVALFLVLFHTLVQPAGWREMVMVQLCCDTLSTSPST